MNAWFSIWSAWRRISGRFCRWLLIPALCFLELLFHFWVGGEMSPVLILELMGFSLCLGGLLSLIAAGLPGWAARWFTAAAILLGTIIMMTEYLVGDAYNYYMSPTRILTGAAGVLTDYTEVVISMILANWPRILLALIPFFVLLLSGKEIKVCRRGWAAGALACCLAGAGLGFGGLALAPGGVEGFIDRYDFNACIKNHGIILSMFTELSGIASQGEVMEVPEAIPLPPQETAASEEARDPIYAPHVIPGLDFAELAQGEEDATLRNLYQYLAALTPATENEYTGLFEGKNLIFITAESFSHKVIDPKLTPTLYRLATQGIEFTNYYEPAWSGCTSGGEMVNLSGLAMNCEMDMYSRQKPFNTIGRQLMNRGYFSRAYHNNIYTFYNRHETHVDLGYEQFIGMRSGMEKGVQDVWPQSDREMVDFTLPQYIDQQPFSIYYMTVSGHCRYNQGNAQARKNWSMVEDLPCSNYIKAYLACNLELEYALTSMVSQLEQAGIADDTVIVLTADHSPYGLGPAWCNGVNALAELYGTDEYTLFQKDQNALIIWSQSIEDMDLKIDAPVCSVDILPTLSNLFGLEYDSRLTVGRDVLGSEEAIALWPDRSWVTEKGSYDASAKTFTPLEGAEIPDGYPQRISAIVESRVQFSRTVQNCNFFTHLQESAGLS